MQASNFEIVQLNARLQSLYAIQFAVRSKRKFSLLKGQENNAVVQQAVVLGLQQQR